MTTRFSGYLAKILSNGYTWAILAASFFIGLGMLMEHNGVEHFHYISKAGRQQSGSPALPYCLGISILTMAGLRAILFRIDALKTTRTQSAAKDTLLP